MENITISVDRDSIISTANVLLVALLKFNRVLIPAFIQWRRGARRAWITEAALKHGLRAQLDPEDQHHDEVQTELARRQSTLDPIVYVPVVTVCITIFTIALYCSVIISFALWSFEFTPVQAIIFSFSLIATGTVSEAEILLQRNGSLMRMLSAEGGMLSPEHSTHGGLHMRDGGPDFGPSASQSNLGQNYGAAVTFAIPRSKTEDLTDLE